MDKHIQLMAKTPKKIISILVFENDDEAIDSAIACGVKNDQIIDVHRN